MPFNQTFAKQSEEHTQKSSIPDRKRQSTEAEMLSLKSHWIHVKQSIM